MQEPLARLLEGDDLSRAEARSVMSSIMRGDATAAQVAAVLVESKPPPRPAADPPQAARSAR